MAEDITLKLKIDESLASAKEDFQRSKERGATKRVANSERDFNILVKEIEELNKVSKPTNEQTRKIVNKMKQLNQLLVDLGNASDKVSNATKELIKRQDELREERTKQQKIRDAANKRLSRKDNGELSLTREEQQQYVNGLKRAKGGKQASLDAFVSAGANNDFSAFADPELASKRYKSMIQENQNVLNTKEIAEKAIKNIDLEQAKLEAESITISAGDEIVINASNRQTAVENAVAGYRAKEADPNARPTELGGFNVKTFDKQTSSLGKAFKQLSIYAIALRTVKTALRDAVKTIKDLDKYLTEQAMVTGRTRQETYKLLESYQDLAIATGATTKEVAEVATQFMRQGKTAQDALTLTEAAIKAAKVAGISATDSVNYLTTALNGFRLQAEDAMLVSDKFAAVAAQSATSYEEIALALSKVAAQANLAGMSMDYTIALLAKGIETTREAPETIGTALKTVIARMRELTDYGETLEGDTDVNNVETQLAYIGIALRDNNGELRSTEDVLNDLGEKWDTLNSNQQAAVAKALAGTRQQSRLIAMMSDYERTIELQEIAQRSAGATAAQAATYMEGMEAALNNVSVAWEKIVTAVTNSNVIIDLINGFAGLLDTIGGILKTTAGMVGFVTTIALIGLTILGQKIAELSIAKQQRQFALQQQKIELQNKNIRDKAFISANKERIEKEKAALAEAKATIIELKSQKTLTAEQQSSLAAAEQYVAENQTRIEQESAQLQMAELSVNTYQQQNQLLEGQTSLLGNLGNLMSGITTPLLLAITLYKTIAGWIVKIRTLRSAAHKKEMAEQGAETTMNAMGAAGKIISQLGIWGIPLAVAVVAALTGAILGISAAVKETKKNSLQGLTDDINRLSANIYKLTEKANGIKTITDQYVELDKQIIKTKEDQEEMNKLLDSATDKLSDEEKTIYDTLTTNEKKLQYLTQIEQKARNDANENRRQQLYDLAKMKSSDRDKVLSSIDNSDYLQVQDAIFAINNNSLYEYIDSLATVSEGTESFTRSILESLDPLDAYNYAIEENQESIHQLTDTINNAKDINNIAYADILQSDDYSFSEKIEAYNKLYSSINALNDPTLLEAFNKAYGQWDQLNQLLGSSVKFIDKMGITIDEINELGTALQKLGYDAKEATGKMNDLFQRLSAGVDLRSSILTTFADVLNQFDKTTPEGLEAWNKAYNQIVNAYQSAVGQGALNMGQNLTKLYSQINSFYDKAAKWSSMSEQEKTEFMSDNYALFQGEKGKELYEAFESGDYNRIQLALAENEELQKTIALRLQELQVDLDIEKARRETGDANEAYIAELEKEIDALKDYKNATSKIYQASLELRLDQEKKQLDIYKDYLNKQKQALEDSLNERKDAYQKYFDAINQDKEDEDYEEQATLLMSNLQKLSSSTDANSMQQTKELEKQLADLEKERLETLRERAQEAVLKNMDDELAQINDKFDKLLENNQALLNAMIRDSGNANEFVADTLSTNLLGKSALEAESYINDFKTAYASILPSSALNDISVSSNGSQLILNVNGKQIEIGEATQQDLYSIILNALLQKGINPGI